MWFGGVGSIISVSGIRSQLGEFLKQIVSDGEANELEALSPSRNDKVRVRNVGCSRCQLTSDLLKTI